jgi:hypothetical protein
VKTEVLPEAGVTAQVIPTAEAGTAKGLNNHYLYLRNYSINFI